MDFHNEKYLYNRLKSGDEKAYDFLMNIYYGKLCSYAHSLTHNKERAEDIVQNVMVNLWINRKKISFRISLKSYLYKSVYNEFISEFRKNSKVVRLEKKYIDAIDLVVTDEGLDLDYLTDIVNREIDKLPPKCREVFLLNKKEGLTQIEISEYLNISVKTIESHISRAFKVLNKKLGEKAESIFFLLFDFKNQLVSKNSL